MERMLYEVAVWILEQENSLLGVLNEEPRIICSRGFSSDVPFQKCQSLGKWLYAGLLPNMQYHLL